MCGIVGPALGALGVTGGAAAGGAAASAATGLAGALQGIGTALAIAGPIVQGISENRAARATADSIEQQRQQSAQLNAIQEQRTRQQFSRRLSSQRAAIAERGLSLGSPTAIFLGRSAARELAFAGQAVRQSGLAEQAELSNSARQVRARGRQALLRGGVSASASLLQRAPDIWPELLA